MKECWKIAIVFKQLVAGRHEVQVVYIHCIVVLVSHAAQTAVVSRADNVAKDQNTS